MPRLHNQVNRGVWSNAIKRALGVTRTDEGGIERFGETMTPVVDLWRQPEFFALRDERLLAREHGQAAVAGQLSFIALVNPAGTDKLVVVDAVKVRASAIDSALIGLLADASIAGTVATDVCFAKDRRTVPNVTNAMATTVSRRGSNVATLGAAAQEIVRCSIAATDFNSISPPYVLRPGDALVVELTLANTSLNVTWVARERSALPSEL